MRVIILLLVAAGLGSWYWNRQNSISEESVNRFYQTETEHFMNGRSKELCAMLTKDFVRIGVNSTSQGRIRENANKEESCDKLTKMFGALAQSAQLSTEYRITINHIEIAPDNKSAEVTKTTYISMGIDSIGRVAETSDKSTDTLVIRNGRVLLQKSEGGGITRTIGDRF
ncbi:hypothetical protein [Paraherbaspirillum soli]|uniref:SnoaL-like domain-containing protein n=1 Tax=Paraherbaspirillum soli TaxID=631222 RepID=A0ABW0M8H6_9BURK